MKTLEILERYKRIHKLITRKNTGCPADFAARLGISKSQLSNYLEELRARGAKISYSKTLESYVYLQPVELKAEFSVRIKGNEEEHTE
jgi:predicted DNA-binding transcriptional regulator YafY